VSEQLGGGSALSHRARASPSVLLIPAPRAHSASPVLTASILSVGAVHCACLGTALLDRLGARHPTHALARGLAMGCSSYGTGTGTLLQLQEEEAAAVSSVALVLMGVFHSVMCSSEPVLRLLRALGGGAGA
jgi:putative effector of murein hydrolase